MAPESILSKVVVRSSPVGVLFLLFFWIGSIPAAGQKQDESAPCPKPYVKTITPREVGAGEEIKIRGSRFGSTPGSVALAGGANAIIASWSQKRIYATVPAGVPSGAVTVFSACGSASNQSYLTVVKPGHEHQQEGEATSLEGEEEQEGW